VSRDRKSIKEGLIARLLDEAGTALPTSALGRIGRGTFAALRGGRMIIKGRKRRDAGDEPELDMAQVTKIIDSVGKLKGVAMKMGQIMSYIDVDMPKELRDALSVLQTHAQPMEWDVVRALVREEVGERAAQLLEQMEPEPISAASIGQVHRAILPDGTVVAVKIQYPEIARAIEADFGPSAVGARLASALYYQARVGSFLDEAKERFLEECDYLHEAHCQHRFAELYRDHPILVVPAVHGDYCSRRVLTTTYVEGKTLDEYLAGDPTQEDRDRIGEALFEFYIGSLLRHQIYNCDPHPGNYLFMDDGHVSMLDHGCTRQFEPRFVARLANLTRAVHLDRRDAIHRALLDLGIVREGREYDYETIRGFLRGFFGPMLVDEVRQMDLRKSMNWRDALKKDRQLAKFPFPGEFLFLLRIRFGLMSVLSRIGARANWYRLEKRYVEDFAAQHPLLSD
jgi:predicted unusual protein kinase regulating ubiquinone biosynthesis (AarF/ABC1/UbiB family)